MPQSIQFSSAQAGVYQEKQPPTPPGAVAEVAAKVKPGQDLAFAVSGNGMLQAENSPNEGDGSGTVSPPQARGRDTRPGGGLGPHIDAPDPLQKYRWYILGGFAIVLAAERSTLPDVQTFRYGLRLRSSGTNCSSDSNSPVDWTFRTTPRSSEGRALSARGGAQTGSHLATGIREGKGGSRSDSGTSSRPHPPK